MSRLKYKAWLIAERVCLRVWRWAPTCSWIEHWAGRAADWCKEKRQVAAWARASMRDRVKARTGVTSEHRGE